MIAAALDRGIPLASTPARHLIMWWERQRDLVEARRDVVAAGVAKGMGGDDRR
jgi:hypothetical protein